MIIWRNVTIQIGALKPWAENPRFSTKAQAKRLLKSWDELGQFQTIAIGPAGEVYDGHQRLSALLIVYGPDYAVDARQSDRALTDEERRWIVFAANAPVGNWDSDRLASFAPAEQVLEWAGMDALAWGETKRETAMWGEMLESVKPAEDVDAEPQVDRAEELREKWQTDRGQLWRIGEHRLLCGDSTVREDVERVMGGEKAQVCITDPPWNVGWKYDTYKDELTPEQYKEFCDKWRTNSEQVGATLFFVALSMKNYKYFSIWFPMAERIFAECQNFTQHTVGFMQYAFNPILVWGKGEAKSEAGKRDYFIAETSNTKSTPDKELAKVNTATRWLPTVEYLVKFSEDGAIIYEPFAGSGTTLVACQNLSRHCRAIEISPSYVAVCLERMATAFPELTIEKV